jgi:hypothetical protein
MENGLLLDAPAATDKMVPASQPDIARLDGRKEIVIHPPTGWRLLDLRKCQGAGGPEAGDAGNGHHWDLVRLDLSGNKV